MKLASILPIALLSLGLADALAIPATTDILDPRTLAPSTFDIKRELIKRATGDTAADPIDLNLDCTRQVDICNQNCAAILCYGAPRVL